MIPRSPSSRSHKVISTPKMLCTQSPLSSIINLSNTGRRSLPQILLQYSGKKQTIRKSTFNMNPAEHGETTGNTKNIDFTSAMVGEEYPEAEEEHAQKIPKLKINTNELKKQYEENKEEQKELSVELHGAVLRIPSDKKLPQFIPKGDRTPPSCTSREEFSQTEGNAEQGYFIMYCECGCVCSPEQTQCNGCIQKRNIVDFSGVLFIQAETNIDSFWCRLLKMELYCYKSKTDTKYNKLIRLMGAYVKQEETSVNLRGFQLYAFSVQMQKKKLMLYAPSDIDRNVWIQKIREAVGYSNLFSFYEIGRIIGKGSFGEVREAKHKKTKMKVAVKILNKTMMSDKQLENSRFEIETLKLCQHPNIVRLYEIFENADYIYLVLEYLNGGNLLELLKLKNYKLPEATVCKYLYSIATALQYLNKYNVIHRDIKAENIVLASNKEGSEVKIVDFGLSKIHAPGDFNAGYAGTLNYISPEILLGCMYNEKVDMWSLGVLTYLLLLGKLPFSNENMTSKEISK